MEKGSRSSYQPQRLAGAYGKRLKCLVGFGWWLKVDFLGFCLSMWEFCKKKKIFANLWLVVARRSF
jgi:hypothetical protein